MRPLLNSPGIRCRRSSTRWLHEASRERRKLVLDTGQSFLHIEAKLRRLDGAVLHAIGSLGSAKLPSGARVGYWIGHTVGNGPVTAEAAM